MRRRPLTRRWLLACGIAGGALYPLGDVLATSRYPGFSYRDQAVSELFAIGAPTSALVVALFSISSTLLFLFALGIWMSASGQRWMRPLAAMIALGALDALVLWNFFPMHMRGVAPTTTDTVHGLLAINPFVLASLALGALAVRGAFRTYTIATIGVTLLLGAAAAWYVSAFVDGQPTPWMGIVERAAQYAINVWYVMLATLLPRRRAHTVV